MGKLLQQVYKYIDVVSKSNISKLIKFYNITDVQAWGHEVMNQ